MFGAVVGSSGWMEGGTKDIWDGTPPPPPPGEAHASFAVADGEALDEESHGVCQSVVSTLQAVAPAAWFHASLSWPIPVKVQRQAWKTQQRPVLEGVEVMAWNGRECKQTISVGKCIVAWHREDVRTGDLEVREGEVFRVEYVQSPRYVLSLLWYIGMYCRL
ncbi:uncharacterized protein CLUP02_07763 [Colletotrichum lupini]|uniref:Uncharacterized protein n=1 Tax=Colletotrichum lupini TaxID=145971 RepID=A0A9Q8SRQ3_9PEZI|nr:uncharacterized protein CLUP02_07763 [Colletotrichum lupini]UQC82276.1 hypothetical protein CLUP02_07763 [Colletotrichum lupini]